MDPRCLFEKQLFLIILAKYLNIVNMMLNYF